MRILALALLAALAGCSTGQVTIGADFSCLAFSVKPAVEFTGLSFGRSEIVVTNVTCSCASLNSPIHPLPHSPTP